MKWGRKRKAETGARFSPPALASTPSGQVKPRWYGRTHWRTTVYVRLWPDTVEAPGVLTRPGWVRFSIPGSGVRRRAENPRSSGSHLCASPIRSRNLRTAHNVAACRDVPITGCVGTGQQAPDGGSHHWRAPAASSACLCETSSGPPFLPTLPPGPHPTVSRGLVQRHRSRDAPNIMSMLKLFMDAPAA